MDHSHQLIDAISARKVAFNLPENSATIYQHQAEKQIDEDRRYIMAAEKFDVSDLVPVFDTALMLTALDAFENDMLPMPYSICFFNMDKTPFGNLDKVVQGYGTYCMVAEDRGDHIFVFKYLCFENRWQSFRFHVDILKTKDRNAMFRMVPAKWLPSGVTPSDGEKAGAVEAGQKVLQILACMETSHVSRQTVLPPPRLNKAREARRVSPIYSHTIVTINMASVEGGGGESTGHASPRLHWRRGHIRTLPSGQKTKVRPCLVGNPILGMTTHEYKLEKRDGYGRR